MKRWTEHARSACIFLYDQPHASRCMFYQLFSTDFFFAFSHTHSHTRSNIFIAIIFKYMRCERKRTKWMGQRGKERANNPLFQSALCVRFLFNHFSLSLSPRLLLNWAELSCCCCHRFLYAFAYVWNVYTILVVLCHSMKQLTKINRNAIMENNGSNGSGNHIFSLLLLVFSLCVCNVHNCS